LTEGRAWGSIRSCAPAAAAPNSAVVAPATKKADGRKPLFFMMALSAQAFGLNLLESERFVKTSRRLFLGKVVVGIDGKIVASKIKSGTAASRPTVVESVSSSCRRRRLL
jgi:hypothetical protein